jgi:hypothetical protein
MFDTHMEWGDMARFGVVAAIFLLVLARMLLRG